MFIAFLTLGFIPARRLTSFNVGIVPFQASERNWQIVCVHAVRPSWTSLSLLWPNCCGLPIRLCEGQEPVEDRVVAHPRSPPPACLVTVFRD